MAACKKMAPIAEPEAAGEAVVAEPEIAFNAGTHREVIHMRTAEFRRVAKPDIVSLVREPAMHHGW